MSYAPHTPPCRLQLACAGVIKPSSIDCREPFSFGKRRRCFIHSFIDDVAAVEMEETRTQQQITQQHGAPAAVVCLFYFTIILFYNSIAQVVTLSASTIDASSFLLPHKKTIEWMYKRERAAQVATATAAAAILYLGVPRNQQKNNCCVRTAGASH